MILPYLSSDISVKLGLMSGPSHTAPTRTPRLSSVSSWKSNSSSGSAVVVFDTLEKRLYTAFEGDTTGQLSLHEI